MPKIRQHLPLEVFQGISVSAGNLVLIEGRLRH